MSKPLATRARIAVSLAGTLLAACNSDKPAVPPAAEAPAAEIAAPTEQMAAPAAPVAAPAPAPANAPAAAMPTAPPTLRCGDLLSADQLTTAGLDAKGYDPNKTPDAPGAGVTCVLSTMSVTLFPGDAYGSMFAGWKENGPQNGVLAAEGPAIGGASQWTTMGDIQSLMFQSANQRYAANLTGSSQAAVAKLARVLAANMEQR